MKTGIFVTLALLLSVQLATAQCQANAGGNMHFCMELYTTTAVIGGTPTASGGTAPYTYSWSAASGPTSYFLNDSTLANPPLTLNNISSPSALYLKVTDALGCVSYDTCHVTFTQFTYGLANVTVYIDQTMI